MKNEEMVKMLEEMELKLKGLESKNLELEKEKEELKKKSSMGKVGREEEFLMEVVKCEVRGEWFDFKKFYKNYVDNNGNVISSGNISSIKTNSKKHYGVEDWMDIKGSGRLKMFGFKSWIEKVKKGEIKNWGMFLKVYDDEVLSLKKLEVEEEL